MMLKMLMKMKRTKVFANEAVSDMKKIDLGITLCHFALAAKENDINICLCVGDLGIMADADIIYCIVSISTVEISLRTGGFFNE